MILAGQGVLLSEATEELLEFITRPAHPGRDEPQRQRRDRRDPRACARRRSAATVRTQANEATSNADVLLALGCSFDDRTTSAWIEGYTLKIPPTPLIQIDIDPTEIGRNYPAEIGIIGDVKARASRR